MLGKKPSITIVVVALLVVFLPVVAALQYRWLGQVSDGERQRMQSSLKSSVDGFSRDFDREIIRAYLNFQIDSTSDNDRYTAYVRSYDLWRRSSGFPGLIGDIFYVSVSNGSAALSKFDRAAGKMEPVEWPDELAALRQKLSETRKSPMLRAFKTSVDQITIADQRTDHKEDAAASTADIMLQGPVNPLDPDIPALVVPVTSFQSKRLPALSDITPRSSFTIVKLNLECIKNEILPELARKHFAGSEGLNYNVTVVRRDQQGGVVFATEPRSAGPDPSRADATVGIFGIKLDQIEEFLRGELWHKAIESQRGNRTARVLIRSINDHQAELSDGPVALYEDSQAGQWDAIVQHRSGSLEAAVTNTRRRNLILSFSVLLLLAASVALIAVSSRGAMRLARQQMEFVAGISHELRTPLAVIRSAGENLSDGLIQDKGQVREYGDLIQSEGRRLTAMVEQVLEFAGAQSGRKTFELQPLDINRIIHSALESCKAEIDQGGFDVETIISQELPLVMADGNAISRSLQNLISNAMKYSGASRRIVVEAVPARDERGDMMVAVVVRDQGIGLASAEAAHVFEPFYRGKEAVAAQIHGSGLGLSIVKHIVESHGGQLTVDSAPGKGSAFKFTLKAASEPAAVSAS